MKRKWIAGLLVLLLAFGLVACGNSASSGNSSGGTTGSTSGDTAGDQTESASGDDGGYSEITVSRFSMPSTLEPHDVDNPHATTVTFHIFDRLVKFDNETNEWSPCIAKSWEQIDATTWNFEINLDTIFHNGDQLTMDDVVFSFERAKDFPRSVDTINNIDSISYEGNILTIKFKNDEIATPNKVLAIGYIVNKKYIEEGGEDAMYLKPIGTGPYQVTEFTPIVSCSIEAFEGYTGGKVPNIDKINFVEMRENDARYIALESGQIQFAGDLTVLQMDLVDADDNLAPLVGPTQTVYCLAFQTQRPPFDNVNVRRALIHALDVQAFSALTDDKAATSMLFVGYDDVYYESDKYPEYNLDKAKELLEAEGYNASNPLKFELLAPLVHAGQEMYQAALKGIGVEMTITRPEFSAYIPRETGSDFDMIYAAQGNRGNHYLTDLDRFSNDMFGSRNFTLYTTPEAQKIIDELRVTTDPQRSAELIKEINDILADEVPMAGIYQNVNRGGMDKRLTGVEWDGWGRVHFENASYSG